MGPQILSEKEFRIIDPKSPDYRKVDRVISFVDNEHSDTYNPKMGYPYEIKLRDKADVKWMASIGFKDKNEAQKQFDGMVGTITDIGAIQEDEEMLEEAVESAQELFDLFSVNINSYSLLNKEASQMSTNTGFKFRAMKNREKIGIDFSDEYIREKIGVLAQGAKDVTADGPNFPLVGSTWHDRRTDHLGFRAYDLDFYADDTDVPITGDAKDRVGLMAVSCDGRKVAVFYGVRESALPAIAAFLAPAGAQAEDFLTTAMFEDKVEIEPNEPIAIKADQSAKELEQRDDNWLAGVVEEEEPKPKFEEGAQVETTERMVGENGVVIPKGSLGRVAQTETEGRCGVKFNEKVYGAMVCDEEKIAEYYQPDKEWAKQKTAEEEYTTGCDGGCLGAETKFTHRLDTGGGSGAYLCKECWAKEMEWRKDRNTDLAEQSKFDILPWPGDKKPPRASLKTAESENDVLDKTLSSYGEWEHRESGKKVNIDNVQGDTVYFNDPKTGRFYQFTRQNFLKQYRFVGKQTESSLKTADVNLDKFLTGPKSYLEYIKNKMKKLGLEDSEAKVTEIYDYMTDGRFQGKFTDKIMEKIIELTVGGYWFKDWEPTQAMIDLAEKNKDKEGNLKTAAYLVSDDEFNRAHYPHLIGRYFDVAPSYTMVEEIADDKLPAGAKVEKLSDVAGKRPSQEGLKTAMRQLTRSQKKLLDEWYEKNRDEIQGGVISFDIADSDLFPYELLEQLREINDTEILEGEINRYISDKGMNDGRPHHEGKPWLKGTLKTAKKPWWPHVVPNDRFPGKTENDKKAEELLKDQIAAHEAGRCKCDLTDGGYGLCYAGQWLEGVITSEDVIGDLSPAGVQARLKEARGGAFYSWLKSLSIDEVDSILGKTAIKVDEKNLGDISLQTGRPDWVPAEESENAPIVDAITNTYKEYENLSKELAAIEQGEKETLDALKVKFQQAREKAMVPEKEKKHRVMFDELKAMLSAVKTHVASITNTLRLAINKAVKIDPVPKDLMIKESEILSWLAKCEDGLHIVKTQIGKIRSAKEQLNREKAKPKDQVVQYEFKKETELATSAGLIDKIVSFLTLWWQDTSEVLPVLEQAQDGADQILQALS